MHTDNGDRVVQRQQANQLGKAAGTVAAQWITEGRREGAGARTQTNEDMGERAEAAR